MDESTHLFMPTLTHSALILTILLAYSTAKLNYISSLRHFMRMKRIKTITHTVYTRYNKKNFSFLMVVTVRKHLTIPFSFFLFHLLSKFCFVLCSGFSTRAISLYLHNTIFILTTTMLIRNATFIATVKTFPGIIKHTHSHSHFDSFSLPPLSTSVSFCMRRLSRKHSSSLI